MDLHEEHVKLSLHMTIFFVLLLLLPVSATDQWIKVSRLPLSNDLTFKQEINEVLDKFYYIFPYRPDRFDCYETSIFAIKILRDWGYEPFLMERSYWPGYDTGHLWVAVPKKEYNGLDDLRTWAMNNTWVMIETTADMRDRLGVIVLLDEYRNGTLVYDEVEFLHENETALVWYVLKENPYSFVEQRWIEPVASLESGASIKDTTTPKDNNHG
jgi:hypothetical protein